MDPVLAAVLAAVFGPLGAYLLAARRFSGKVTSSDAAQLWEESRSIREWSYEQSRALSDRVSKLEERIDGLLRENAELRLTIREHEATIKDLRDQLERARARVTELERKSGS